MNRTDPTARGRKLVLPVLALLLTSAVASIVYALFEFQDFEMACARSEQVQRLAGARLRVHGTRAGKQRRGELIAAPTTSAELRAMVAFCDTSTARDVAALREVALGSTDTLAAANAVRALGRLHVVARDAAVAALVHDSRARVRDETILALGESGDVAAAETLEPLARRDDPKVRLLALRALGRLGGERASAVARDVIDRPAASRDERAFARAALDGARAR